jgi:hypothetical protein
VGSQDSALSSLPQPLLNFEWFDCQRGLAAEARNHFLVQNPLVSLRSCISLLDGCLRLVFHAARLNVMLTELPIRRWIPLGGLILVSVFPETLPFDFLPRILLARPGQIVALARGADRLLQGRQHPTQKFRRKTILRANSSARTIRCCHALCAAARLDFHDERGCEHK